MVDGLIDLGGGVCGPSEAIGFIVAVCVLNFNECALWNE